MSIDAWGDGWELDTSCSGGVCGTGEWAGPKPGDPDNNITLSANGAVGGVNEIISRWCYTLYDDHFTFDVWTLAHRFKFGRAMS